MKLLKLTIIIALFFTSLIAEDRPKIALVLSGGGSRGAAHVGVLKILEKNRVPVDMIVGTSMGSLVGGLYASGKTPQEIEDILGKTDWTEYIRTDFNRADTPMRKKEIDYLYQGRLGLGINTDNELVLPTGVLKRQPMLYKLLKETQHAQNIKDFDKLPIPFRAVATNIKNGDRVVLKSGVLAESIYASLSVPGGFQPINIDGIYLVDGGVSENMPVSVAQELGADIIIAVDVSENFDDNIDVDSYLVIMSQLVNILTRKNVNESITTLRDKDILLTPDLNGFSSFDADKYIEIIQKGVDVSTKNESSLQTLSLSDSEYEEYRQKYRKKIVFTPPVVDKIELENSTYLSDNSILNRLHINTGEVFDEELLRADLLHIYNMMVFDTVDYSLKTQDGENILVISTAPSLDNHGEVRFAIGLEDDFDGHSSYSLKFGYTMFGLNSYGGEWKNDFEIGTRQRAYTEIFQPLDSRQSYYIKPSIGYKSITDIVPINRYIPSEYGNVELTTKRYGGSFALGMYVSTDYEFEVGASLYKDRVVVDTYQVDDSYDARPIYASFKSDSLDNIHFPKYGFKSEIKWTKEMNSWGSDYDYQQVYLDFEKPFTLFANNITAYFKYGKTYDVPTGGVTSLAGSYTLGGMFNLSGYAPYSLNDDNMVFGALRYRYQISGAKLLDLPLYTGFSLETGNTWSSDADFKSSDLKYSGALYIAADTFLGPFYLAYGYSKYGEHSGYLYLGEKF